MNKSVKIVILTFLTVILLIIGSVFFVKIQITPKHYENNTEFVVEKGAYGKQVFEDLEEAGIIGPADGAKPRQVLVPDLDTLDQLLNTCK